ncbi:DUF6672 family protein [Parasphaerochaeta coccoides]|uniref:Uncharacterized protein n=1 Tax=Parasphaerochaeta coccoides (strain ATCC BAA-1237 / DSM 17374 / SPN1) TaxID=760011 RepID=F4GKI4_PARC1|nr:DUF6672 family protein [Parasphaerochaeta coccoides]AEC02867.1 hypothetical protein Spico_1669 [Parasphaerochaeta coccoides DSM 17374]
MNVKERRLLIRIGCVLLILAVALWMYFIGRQHTVLVDNRAVEQAGGTIQALKVVEVQVDGQKVIELFPRDRDQFTVTGQRHTITMRFTDSSYNDVEIVRSFRIPVGEDMVLISLPTFAADSKAGQDVWLSSFKPLVAPAAPVVEEVPVEEEVLFLEGF